MQDRPGQEDSLPPVPDAFRREIPTGRRGGTSFHNILAGSETPQAQAVDARNLRGPIGRANGQAPEAEAPVVGRSRPKGFLASLDDLREARDLVRSRRKERKNGLSIMRFSDTGEAVALNLPASVVPGEADRYAEASGSENWQAKEPRLVTPNIAFREQVAVGTTVGDEERPGAWQYYVVDRPEDAAARVGEEQDVFVRSPNSSELQEIRSGRRPVQDLAKMDELHPDSKQLFESRERGALYGDNPLVQKNMRPAARRIPQIR